MIRETRFWLRTHMHTLQEACRGRTGPVPITAPRSPSAWRGMGWGAPAVRTIRLLTHDHIRITQHHFLTFWLRSNVESRSNQKGNEVPSPFYRWIDWGSEVKQWPKATEMIAGTGRIPSRLVRHCTSAPAITPTSPIFPTVTQWHPDCYLIFFSK